MYRKAITLLLAPTAVLVFAGVNAGETDVPESAGVLTVHEIMTKQDSVFSVIDSLYQDVKYIFQYSCFDCHSQFTNYPWYHKLPIVKGFIDDDIAEGLESMDLSDDFPFSGKGGPLKILREIKKEIEEEEMPPLGYRMFHWGRLIEDERRDSVFQWIDNASLMLSDFFDQYGAQEQD